MRGHRGTHRAHVSHVLAWRSAHEGSGPPSSKADLVAASYASPLRLRVPRTLRMVAPHQGPAGERVNEVSMEGDDEPLARRGCEVGPKHYHPLIAKMDL